MNITKKKGIVFVAVGVSIVLLLSSLIIWFAAKNQGGYESTKDNLIHKVEGTLHKVNVTESNVKFVENKKTDYKIYLDLNEESNAKKKKNKNS